MNGILCPGPKCGHDIDAHSAGDVCWGCITRWEQGGDIALSAVCRRLPSMIADAALTAEPTDDEVEAAAEALYEASQEGNWRAPQFSEIGEAHAESFRDVARAALRAAKWLS